MTPSRNSRVGSVDTMYFQGAGEQPVSEEGRCMRVLKSDEQPYQRRLDIGQAWVELDTGWLTECSYIRLTNTEGTNLQTIPTPEVRAELETRIVEIGYGGKAFAYIVPSDFLRFCPPTLDGLQVRCRSGKARISYKVYPG